MKNKKFLFKPAASLLIFLFIFQPIAFAFAQQKNDSADSVPIESLLGEMGL